MEDQFGDPPTGPLLDRPLAGFRVLDGRINYLTE